MGTEIDLELVLDGTVRYAYIGPGDSGLLEADWRVSGKLARAEVSWLQTCGCDSSFSWGRRKWSQQMEHTIKLWLDNLLLIA
jgi:hypothetical protein